MTNLLIKLFIGKNRDVNDPAVYKRFAALAGAVGVLVNVLLFALKLTVGVLAASVAVIADAFNNISDAGSAIIAFIGMRLALKPVDKEHPLGHGRLEYISGFIVDALIILVGFELFKSSIDKILHPVAPKIGTLTLVLLGIAALAKVWLFLFYRKMGKILSSSSIRATAADSISDALATTVVLLSALLYKAFSWNVDGWAGIVVAAFILFTGLKAAKETIDLLLGSPPAPEFIEKIYAFALRYPEVSGIHDVMVHDYGPGRQFVSFHAEVPADCDITAAHDVIDLMEREMEQAFGCIVTVHMDPIETNDGLVAEMRAFAEEAAKQTDERFLIHDFRMTYGGKHINLIFDLCIPVDCKMSKDEAAKAVAKRISEQKPDCYAVIKPEHPFV